MRLHSVKKMRRSRGGRDASDRLTGDLVAGVEKQQAFDLDSSLKADFNRIIEENRDNLLRDDNDVGFDDLCSGFFKSRKSDFEKLFSLIETASLFLSEYESTEYDEIVNIADYWAKLAALARVYLPLPKFAQDNRQGTLDRIEDSFRRRIKGKVVSNSMNKTIVVEVVRRKRDRLTGKTISYRKKYHVHDEHEECEVGDYVVAIEGRPLSKRKRHSLLSKATA